MASELLEIQPQELKFTFELKKQSSCSVQLVNKSNHYVAFKVKTTAPKKYCVRPNTGIVLPRTTCDFTVTMQAQKVAPSDLQCKDKFLVQSTIVPFGTTEEDLNANLFSKENGRFIEENKLRVVLVSPPHSPVLQPISGALKQEPASISPGLKESPVLKESPDSPLLKESPILKENPILKGGSVLKESPAVKESPILKESPTLKESLVSKESPVLKEAPATNDSPVSKDSCALKETPPRGASDIENLHPSHVSKNNDVENSAAGVNHLESKLKEESKISGTQPLLYHVAQDNVENFTAKINHLESKLEEVLLRRKCAARVQVGFPFLFVCFVAMVSLAVGYLVHS
ncbi:hypothetical protein Taro_023788 [Colocasia esculenta]|uniref:MSP domain-containing protein n=1 Tax=Colocasia esculenta TaxID=4460 RepID=A0A843VCG9_COLES|nr:hypothetical protein [Colocasia esculenta]